MKSALSALQKIVGSHGMVCLDTDNNEISTSNHVQWATVKYEFPAKLGKFNVEFGLLHSFIRNTSGDLSFILQGPTLRVGHMGASITLPIDIREHWSPVGNFQPLYTQIIDAEIWKIISPVAKGDISKPTLEGIAIQKDGIMASHLARVVMWAKRDYREAQEAILTRDFVSRFEEGAILEIGSHMACLKTDDITIYAKLIQGDYPNFRPGIPKCDKSFLLDAAELKDALQAVTIVNDIIQLDCDDTYCCITAIGKDGQKAEAVISCSGDPVKLELSAKQLTMATSFVEDTVKIEFIDPHSPLKIEQGFWVSAIAGRRF